MILRIFAENILNSYNQCHMSIKLNIKKGLDLKIAGAITTPSSPETVNPTEVSVCPDDFPGLILKPEKKEGEPVSAGEPLLRDKLNPMIKIAAPVSGILKEIVRGERRKILRVVVAAGPQIESVKKSVPPQDTADSIIESLAGSGLWAMMRQRPYGIVPKTDITPRDIFVTALDTSPLAPDFGFILENQTDGLKKGVEILKKLTSGKVYVGRYAGSAVSDIPGAEMVDITGPHPAGNAGTMIANIAPVNKGETVWTLDGITLARIGRFFLTGNADFSTIVAVTGSEVKKPGYVKTIVGAPVSELLKGNVVDDNRTHRIISGNVLTGIAVGHDGFLRYPYTQVTVIPEGDDVDEFMGWASLSPSKMSVSRSFPGHFLKKIFKPDARLQGGRRAMIMSGEYDEVIPMDILGEYLIKAILSRDIDRMEQLGIYEVVPEDFALAEYVDTSKLELQHIVAEGLEYMRKETE